MFEDKAVLNIDEINRTINTLENGDTTYDSCLKLASLYIVRQNINKRVNEASRTSVEREYDDILPLYQNYVDIKYQYQLGQISSDVVISSMGSVCKEIREFIQTLYSCTDMNEERELIKQMFQELQNIN